MLDAKATELVGTVPLSNYTISRRIGDLAEDVKAIYFHEYVRGPQKNEIFSIAIDLFKKLQKIH